MKTVLTVAEAMAALESKGSEQTRQTYLRHGATEPLFGVKFGDLRPLGSRRRPRLEGDMASPIACGWLSTRSADGRIPRSLNAELG